MIRVNWGLVVKDKLLLHPFTAADYFAHYFLRILASFARNLAIFARNLIIFATNLTHFSLKFDNFCQQFDSYQPKI